MGAAVLSAADPRYALLFRDYLRAHPATADLKDSVCELVHLPAEERAARTGW
jgi:GrpB-like predicted nucleotidyltransferase (UPF0157 family)